MSFNNKIIELLAKKKMTKATLAKAAGVPYTTLDSMLKRSTDSERVQSLYKIAECLDVSLEYLVFDDPVVEGSYSDAEKQLVEKYRLLDKRGKNTVKAIIEHEENLMKLKAEKTAAVLYPNIKKSGKIREIPLYDAPAAAGEALPIMSDSYSMVKITDAPSGADFGIKISGDSMEPEIPNGSIVYVSKQESIEDGEIGIFLLNGESLCKKFSNRDGKCLLISLNPKYQPIKVLESDNLRIVGKLIM